MSASQPIQPASEPPPPLVPRQWHLRLDPLLLLATLGIVACSLVAAPILYLLFGGSTGHGQDDLTASMLALTHQFGLALGLGNLLTSLADKLMSGFVALAGASMLGVQVATEPSRPAGGGVSPLLRARPGATTG